MSQETIRCHFNTRDAKLLQSDNNADALFPLRHLSFDAMNDEILSVASIKSVLPDSISSVRVDEDNAILEIISTEPATAPAVTATPLKLFITKSEVVLPEWNATTQITNFKSPLRYINSIQDLINIINRMLSSRIQGGTVVSALSYNATGGILSLTDNSHKISFNNNYFVKSLLSPLYQKSNEIMANWLGINKDTAEPLTTLGSTEVNRVLAYKVNMNHAPLYLVCRLGLDSVSSKRETLQNNIITSIPIHLGYQSFLTKIDIETVTPPAPLITDINQKVNLDGSDDHINIPMDSNNPVLNWDQSWSIGFTAEEIHDASSGVGVKRTIATRGTNGIYLIIGTGNVGFYASATDGHYDPANNQGMTHAHGANTWYPTPASVKWLFTYNHTTGKLRWHVGEVINGATPSHTQRGVVTMTTTERTINQSTEDLNIGDSMDGYYGSTYFDGHLDDLLITNNEMTGQQIVDYYTDDDFQSHEYSEHIISLYNFNQVYPIVDDQVGSYNGTHQGSTNSDNFISN
jgi:hypothetical protein